VRAASVCIRAGARVLPGLRSDLTLNRETQEVTYDWLAELEEASSADSEYGVVHCSPHRLAGLTSISTQLNAQAPDGDSTASTFGMPGQFLPAEQNFERI